MLASSLPASSSTPFCPLQLPIVFILAPPPPFSFPFLPPSLPFHRLSPTSLSSSSSFSDLPTFSQFSQREGREDQVEADEEDRYRHGGRDGRGSFKVFNQGDASKREARGEETTYSMSVPVDRMLRST